ncbi:MAG: adenylate/guanylate cyclase domain-containing protein [Actinomycetes bacterium]
MSDTSTLPMPQGLVTFLFTDVVGSTLLWEEAPEAMAAAMAEHDRLIEAVVARRRGHVVRPRGEGDSRFAVFSRASDAVLAAVDIQRTIRTQPWPTPRPVTIRLAVHTGEADVRDGDYYGRAVNRAARLRSVGHPGQILVSGATHDVAQDIVGSDLTMHPLGAIALADLERPEPVYQVEHPGLERDFPPLRTSDRNRVRLPPLPADFVGRATVQKEISSLLTFDGHRLVTLTGPGGIGKTQLAVATARAVRSHFPDGVVFVSLADVGDASTALYSLAAAAEVREQRDEPLVKTICRSLSSGPALLILDNCEQVSGFDSLVGDLLQEGTQLTVLATSRTPLRLQAERRFPVPPLEIPDEDVVVDSPMRALTFSGIDFFVRRARAVDPDFALTTEAVPVVVAICRGVEGSPLALELAAARTDVLSLGDIKRRLSEQLTLLADGHSDLPERQRTVRSTIAWSTSLLNEDERRLLFALGELAGPFVLSDAEAMHTGKDTPMTVARLVDSSLVQRLRSGSGIQFRMADAVREFCRNELVGAASLGDTRLRLLHHLSAMLEREVPALQTAQADSALQQIRRRYEDVRSLVTWALEGDQLDEAGLLLSPARRYWVYDGHLAEPLSWLEAWLSQASRQHRQRARVMLASGVLAYLKDDPHLATDRLSACCVTHPPTAEAALASGYLGAVALGEGDPKRAGELAQDCEVFARATDNYEAHSLALSLRAVIAAVANDTARERELYGQRLALARKQGDGRRTAETLNNLAEVSLAEGDAESAASYAEAALVAAHESGRMATRDALYTQSRIDLLRDDPAIALVHARESLQLSVHLGQLFETSQSIGLIGAIAAALDQPARGAELMAAALDLRVSGEAPLELELEPEFARYREDAASRLGLAAFEELMAKAHSMPLEAAVQVALGIRPTR